MYHSFSGIEILESPHLPPDFYSISDWHRPRETAIPRWLSVIFIQGRAVAHPTVIRRLREEAALQLQSVVEACAEETAERARILIAGFQDPGS